MIVNFVEIDKLFHLDFYKIFQSLFSMYLDQIKVNEYDHYEIVHNQQLFDYVLGKISDQ